MKPVATPPGELLSALESAIAREPSSPRLRIQQAQTFRALGKLEQAFESAAAARQLAEDDPQALEALAAFYATAQREAMALGAYDRLLQLAPEHAGALFNRAAMRRFTGDLEGAEADYDRLLRLQPYDYEARYNRSELRVQTPGRNHVAELEQLLERRIRDWRGEMQTRYALAKEYEDLGEYAKSWRQLSAGAGLRRSHLSYDVARDVQTVEWIREAFSEPGSAAAGHPNPAPIFIVGLPRSGTTLIERIVSSHSAVTAGGELDHFTAALMEEVNTPAAGRPPGRRELIERAARVNFAAVGRRYTARTEALTALRQRFTDKLPLNYLYCGLIRRALPQSRIVHVTRHPLAVCHAMYKTLFKQGYPFSYDLDDIASYYIAYRRLMHHWEQTLPGFIHELSYERLIAEQAAQTRRLLEFCGLEWDANCLAFELNTAPTTTASASQVRRPIYGSSVSLWKHYSSQLSDLRAQLERAGIEIP